MIPVLLLIYGETSHQNVSSTLNTVKLIITRCITELSGGSVRDRCSDTRANSTDCSPTNGQSFNSYPEWSVTVDHKKAGGDISWYERHAARPSWKLYQVEWRLKQKSNKMTTIPAWRVAHTSFLVLVNRLTSLPCGQVLPSCASGAPILTQPLNYREEQSIYLLRV